MNKILKGLDESVRRHRNMLALIDENTQFTYDEVDRLSSLLAAKIVQYTQGETEKPVVIFMGRSVYFVISMIAVLKADCYYVPAEFPFPRERLDYIRRELNADIFIVDNKSYDELQGRDGELTIINLLELSTDEKIDTTYELANSEDHNLCYTIYTSGTTGKPKGVCIQYNSLYNLVISLYHGIYQYTPGHFRIALLASFSFDASVKQIYCSLLFGHTLVISDTDTKYFGRKLLNFYRKWDIYLTDITPTLIRNIVLQCNKSIPCNVQYFLIGGEVLTWQCVYDFIEKIGYSPKLINLYGPTECCVDVSYYYIPATNNVEHGPVPIGKAIENVQLDLIDDIGTKVTEACAELFVTGVCVARGYVHQDIDNKFGVSPLNPSVRTYRTGDIAYRDCDGNHIIVGRKDDQLKINGNRVELSEIEHTIKTHPFIQACVVLSNNNKLYCFAVSDLKESLALYDYLKDYLPSYMIPANLLFIDSLPINHNGKIDKKVFHEIIKAKDRPFLLLKDW
ncbi:amino acid adenylation domain-containing protein [Paenibacillus sp. FSL K6-2524]|uniref:amino acid adenylation domain-containing protein n=1 Tax=Paenibacillus sp. FSL K6-2524 TaxID=2954516 RepID=UPI0030FB0ADF